jgi:hypothetical protein
MPHNPLQNILDRLGRRVLMIHGTAGTFWSMIAAAACLACGVWLDLMLELPAGLRMIVLGSAISAAIVVFVRSVRKAIRSKAPAHLAARLDQVSASGGQVLSAVDLVSADVRTFATHAPNLSAGLARLAIERGTKIATGVPRGSVAPTAPVIKSMGVLALAGAAAFVFVLLLPRLAATEWQRFADPFGDHPPFSTITFTVEPGDAQVVYGSGLEVRTSVSGTPVEGVELVLETPAATADGTKGGSLVRNAAHQEIVPMFPEQEGRWRASVANIIQPLTYFVRARGARSRKFSVQVLTVPLIEDVQYRIAAPEYTRQPTYEGPLPQGGLAGLPGAIVCITIRSNRPLSKGLVTYFSGQNRQKFDLDPLDSGTDSRVSGTFLISASGRIEAHVVDTNGQASSDKVAAPVTLLADERPFVRLVEPRAVSFATPTAVIPVVISAEDDYGVARLQLFRSLNDSRYLPLDVAVAEPPARLAYQMVPLPLRDYGLEPGDEIKLFARVEDNDRSSAESPGKGAESSVVVLRIISQQEFDQYRQTRDGMETLMAKYQQANRRLESLAEEIEKVQAELRETKAGEQPPPELREKLKELSEKMAEEAEALRKLAQDKQPFEIDEELTKELAELADQIEQLQKKMQKLADDDQAGRDEIEKRLAELANALREQREKLDEEAMQPLEKLAAVLPLSRDEQKFAQIYLRQRELSDRLASLKGRDGEDDPALKARMRDLEDEQRKIRSDLEALLSDIEEHLAGLPEDAEFNELRDSAREFVDALRESGATEAMLEAENGLSEFSGTRGHAAALEAADILEQFLQKAGQMGQQGAGQAMSRRFSPGLGGAMGKTLQQMLNRGKGRKSMGQGGGDGYSTDRNTSDNVGLYGSDQNYNQSQSGGEGMRQRQNRSGNGPRTPGRTLGGSGDGPREAPGNLRASGGSDAAIPLRYRRQVGRYFQRVADELGDSGK